MLSYCLKCKKNTQSNDPVIAKTSIGKPIILLKCAIWGAKKSKFIKEQEAKGLLSSLSIRTHLTKLPLLEMFCFGCNFIEFY